MVGNQKKRGRNIIFLLIINLIVIGLLVLSSTVFASNNETNHSQPGMEAGTNSSEDPLTPSEPASIAIKIIDFVIDKLRAVKGEFVNIQAKLVYDNNSPVIGKQVNFYGLQAKNAANYFFIGTNTTTSLGQASVVWDTEDVEPGEYKINVSVEEVSDTRNMWVDEVSLTQILTMVLDKVRAIKGEVVKITAELAYNNNSPLPGKTINFYTYPAVNSAMMYFLGNEVTDSYGKATIDWDTANFDAGEYVVNAKSANAEDYENVVIDEEMGTTELNLTAVFCDVRGCVYDSQGNAMPAGTNVTVKIMTGSGAGRTRNTTTVLHPFCGGNSNYYAVSFTGAECSGGETIRVMAYNETVYGLNTTGTLVADGTETVKLNTTETFGIVTLELPLNNSVESNNDIQFMFNITHRSQATKNCSIYLNNVYNKTNATTVLNDTAGQYINVTNMANADYNWYIKCYDANDVDKDSLTYKVTVSANSAPTISSLKLNATSLYNLTTDNLTLHYNANDPDGGSVTNITDWRLWNGTAFESIAIINLPMDVNYSNVKSYSTHLLNFSKVVQPRVIQGKIGNALNFTGSEYLQRTTTPPMNHTGSFTWMAWIKPTESTGSTRGIYHVAGNNEFYLNVNGEYLIAGAANAANTVVTAGVWQHVALVYNGTGINYYYNGQPDGIDDSFTPDTWGATTRIGVNANGLSEYFVGGIDELKIFDKGLSQEQIEAIYEAESQGKNPKILVAEDTNADEVWKACVTPSDTWEDGTTQCSNNLTVNDYPKIHLEQPQNNSRHASAFVRFYYNVTTDLEIANCSLYINGLLNKTNTTTVTKYQAGQTFDVSSMAPGSYTWKVGCTNSQNHPSNGTTPDTELIFNLTINNPPSESVPYLNATSTYNRTTDNLTLHYNVNDLDGDSVSNITDWRLWNGTTFESIAIINLPMDVNYTNVKSYSTHLLNFSKVVPPKVIQGKIGKALNFTGSEYLERTTTTPMDHSGPYTWMAWIKPTESTGSTRAIYHVQGSNEFYLNVNGKYLMNAANPSNTVVTAGVWQHVALVYNGTGINYYYNGQPDGIDDSFTPDTWGATTRIGVNANGLSEYFVGAIDELKIFDKQLSQEQIQEIYEQESQGKNAKILVSEETNVSDIWKACVTPIDAWEAGTTQCSNNLTITNINVEPSISSLKLNATSTYNLTTDNLTLHYSTNDPNGDSVTNITDWRLWNGTAFESITVLNMPFDTNYSEHNFTNIIKDYSTFMNNGTGGNGTNTESPVWKNDCKIGGCYEFDGVDDYIIVNNDSSLIFNKSMTITAWINLSYAAGANAIVGRWDGAGNNRAFFFSIENSKIRFSVSPNGQLASTRTLTGSYNFENNKWYHVAIRFNGTTAIGYVNGVEDSRQAYYEGVYQTPVPFHIGAISKNSGNFFNGTIDELKVFNRTLTVEQIQAMFEAENQSHKPTTLVSEETNVGETWKACVTPNDGLLDGTTECSNNLTITELTTKVRPTAVITDLSTYNYNVTDTVSFNGSESYDNDDTDIITFYRWTLSNGYNPGNVTNFSYTFNQKGTYKVALQVKDDENNWSTNDEYIIINVGNDTDRYPVANISSPNNYAVYNISTQILFNGSTSYDPDNTNTITEYKWIFSNGYEPGNVSWFEYNFSEPGTYQVWLQVKDDENNWSQLEVYITITINGAANKTVPVADINSPLHSAVYSINESVWYDGATSYDPDDSDIITEYKWVFSDGYNSDEAYFYHNFSAPGTYTAWLQVKDDENNWSTNEEYVTISIKDSSNKTKPVAQINSPLENAVYAVNETINFNALTSYDPDDTNVITEYKWAFSNGYSPGDVGSFEYNFSKAGTYTVHLQVKDDENNWSTNEEYITINIKDSSNKTKPVAQINSPLDASTYSINESINFDATTSYDRDDTNVITEYKWVFSNGYTSSEENFNYNFSEAGSYTVHLQVKDDENNWSTNTEEIIINVKDEANKTKPVAVINSPLDGVVIDVLEQINFDALTSYDPDDTNVITEYSWTFSNGYNPGNDGNFNYSFSTPGTYEVQLKVKDDENNWSTNTESITINVRNESLDNKSKPVAVINSPLDASTYGINESINFDALRSYDPDDTNVITEYKWVFSNGYTSSEANFDYNFSEAGTYTVQLQVKDDENNWSTNTEEIIISIKDPSNKTKPVAVINSPLDGVVIDVLEQINFDALTSYDPDDTNVITEYSWTFSNGYNPGNKGNFNYSFSTVGTYTVQLQVKDDENNWSTNTESIIINVRNESLDNKSKPVAVINSPLDASTYSINESINFDATTSYDPDDTNVITEYKWVFSNGYTSSEANFDYNFSQAGTYTVQLQVKDDENNWSTNTEEITISVKESSNKTKPVALINSPVDGVVVDVLEQINFDALTSYDPDDTNVIIEYEWTFSNGYNPGNNGNFNYSFSTPGTYTVQLQVKDDENNWSTNTESIIINVRNESLDNKSKPVAVINSPLDASTYNINESINFDATTSYDPDDTNIITEYKWVFSNGYTSSEANFDYNFSQTGTYTVQLQVKDDENNWSTNTEEITISVKESSNKTKPVADINSPMDGVLVDVLEQINFDALTSYDPDDTNIITEYKWTFLNGYNPGNNGNFNYSFSTVGTYTVQLQVKDDENNWSTNTESIIINVRNESLDNKSKPVAVINSPLDASTYNINESINFDATTSYDPDDTNVITVYNWTLSNGYTSSEANFDYNFSQAGTYTVQLQVKDDENNWSTNTEEITISIKDASNKTKPVAVISAPADNAIVELGEEVYFDGSTSYDPDDTNVITEYNWTFSNNYKNNSQSFTYAFTSSGTYTIELQIKDDENNWSSVNATITVTSNDTTAPSFSSILDYPDPANQTNIVQINATITDNSNYIANAILAVTYPFNQKVNYTMGNVTLNVYNYSFTNTSQTGLYTYKIFAVDNDNNWNSTILYNFTINTAPGYGNTSTNITYPQYNAVLSPDTEYNITANISADAKATGCKATLVISNENVLNITSTETYEHSIADLNANSVIESWNVTTSSANAAVNVTVQTVCVNGSSSYNTTRLQLRVSNWLTNVSYPEGIYEPLCCADGSTSCNPVTEDRDCNSLGTALNGYRLHTATFRFGNLTLDSSDRLECIIEWPNHTLFTIQKTGLTLTNDNYTLNYTLNRTNQDTFRYNLPGQSYGTYLPAYIHNCSIRNGGSVTFYQNISRRLYVHNATAWSDEESVRAVSCYNGFPGRYMNNTAYCKATGDVGYVGTLILGNDLEANCQDGVDSNEIPNGKIDCQDDFCKGVAYEHCDPNKNFISGYDFSSKSLTSSSLGTSDVPASPATGNLNTTTTSVGGVTYTITYTQNIDPDGQLRLRLKRASAISNQNFAFAITGLTSINSATSTYHGTTPQAVSFSVNPAKTAATLEDAGATSGSVDFVFDITFDKANLTANNVLNTTAKVSISVGSDNNVGSEPVIKIYFDDGAGKAPTNTNESENSSIEAWTCADGVNNDLDNATGYTLDNYYDCYDVDCLNYTGDSSNAYISTGGGYCENVEGTFNASCFDGFNNDYRNGDSLTDCYDPDCDNKQGNATNSLHLCNYQYETNCSDGFNNDYYQKKDCEYTQLASDTTMPSIGNAEYDCSGYCRANVLNQEQGSNCSDRIDNDYDAIYVTGVTTGSANTSYGAGIDCRWTSYNPDEDCNLTIVNFTDGTGRCELGTELNCTDSFDNDRDQDNGAGVRPNWTANRLGYETFFGQTLNYSADYDDYDCKFKAVVPATENNQSENCNLTSCPIQYNWCFDGVDNDMDNDDGSGGYDCSASPSEWDVDCNNTYFNWSGNIGMCQLVNETNCTDNFDNDMDQTNETGWALSFDGYRTYNLGADCADYSCAGVQAAGGHYTDGTNNYACPINEYSGGTGVGANNNASWCGDGIDNDLDGLSDCADPDCIGVTPPQTGNTCLETEFNGTLFNDSIQQNYCMDGVDNDIGPSDNYWNLYSPVKADCDDKDCWQKFGNCAPCANQEYILWDACFDGVDNDYDASNGNGTDGQEAECQGKLNSHTGTLWGYSYLENTSLLCSDGLDLFNSSSGYDCGDYNCSGVVVGYDGQSCEYSTETSCNDDYDNDGDGNIDCYDSDCFNACGMQDKTHHGSIDKNVANSSKTYSGISTSELQTLSYTQRLKMGQPFVINFNRTQSVNATTIDLGNSTAPFPGSIFNMSAAYFIDEPFNATLYNFTLSNSSTTLRIEHPEDQEVPGGFNLNVVVPQFRSDANLTVTVVNLGVTSLAPPVASSLRNVITIEVVENATPEVSQVIIEPTGTYNGKVKRESNNVQIKVNITDPVLYNAQYEGTLAFCSMKVYGPGYNNAANDSDCKRAYTVTRDGTYTLNVTAYDQAGNPSAENTTTFTIDVTPARSERIRNITNVWTNNNSYTDMESVNASFITADNDVYNSDACLGIIENETGSVVYTSQITAVGAGSSTVTCVNNITISALPLDVKNGNGLYYLRINATDADGYTITSEKQVFFICNNLSYSGSHWTCAYADFDQDGFTEGTNSPWKPGGNTQACDNCPNVYNPSQTDSDIDGTGDLCEASAFAPTINSIQCSNDSGVNFYDCSQIKYSMNITNIAVNCTAYSGRVIDNVTYTLLNEPDNNQTVYALNYTYNLTSEYFVYNLTGNETIVDSGYWNLSVTCKDNNAQPSSSSSRWLVDWGRMVPVLDGPTSNINVNQSDVFTFNASFTCVGGECGSVNATLDPFMINKIKQVLNIKQKAQAKPKPKIEKIVEDKLNKQNLVDVIVILKDDKVLGTTGAKDKLTRRKLMVKSVQNKVLSKLNYKRNGLGISSDTDFMLKRKFILTNGFAGKVTRQGLEKLKNDPNVKEVVEDKVLHTALDVSVPLINADDVWTNYNITGLGQTVCVVDSGINYSHPALGGCNESEFLNKDCDKVLDGYDYYNNDNNPKDDNSHGTHVAGIVASTDSTYRGVAPDAKLVALKACDNAGTCSGSAMVDAVDWCVANATLYNISVITMSIGDQNSYTAVNCPTWMDSSLQVAYDAGITITVASGNEGYTTGINYPGCSPYAISVGATTDSDTIASFTNYEPSVLDVMAPGSDIVSTVLTGFGSKSGTSMATPHAAGLVALMQQYSLRESGKKLLPLAVENYMELNGDDVSGYPRINALATIQNMIVINESEDKVENNNGVINFSGNVNLTNATFAVIIRHNFISVDSHTYPELNTSATLRLNNLSLQHVPVIFRNNELCPEGYCQPLSYNNGLFVFNVSGFSNYSTGPNTNLTIWDQNDTGMIGGDNAVNPNENVFFYANYSNASSATILTTANCTINFTDYTNQLYNMSYNDSAKLFVFNRTFSSGGVKHYNITCNETTKNFNELLTAVDEVNISSVKNGAIPTEYGALPFFTYDQNPNNSCSNLRAGQSCNYSWRVNATASSGSYTFYVIFSPTTYSSYINDNQTDSIIITIGAVSTFNAPENLTVTYIDENTVNLNWTEVSTATGYYVYYDNNATRLLDYTSDTLPDPNVTIADNTITNYSDVYAGIVRYYRVASYSGSVKNVTTNAVGKFKKTLTSGWNSFSTPLNLTNNSLSYYDALNVYPAGSLTSIYYYNNKFEKTDYVNGYGWWKAINSTLDSVDAGKGYFAYATQKANITFVGEVPNDAFNYSLSSGWDLVGWFSTRESSLGDESVDMPINVSTAGCVDTIYRFENNAYNKTDYIEGYGWWGAENGFSTIKPGEAYWFRVKDNCDWRLRM